ncbi:NnrU family protein [Telmatospirillum siberiense]|uniref:NnrU protein n=1 Tax=Telmatospirillum siberiense TaxID=382514 RepID=A0A2N3PY53_9PROT|nr:NnrU family protein [Telmatospirillum siberiense]PKU25301.1 NnrU protein [Telmatospirillum siberiense]
MADFLSLILAAAAFLGSHLGVSSTPLRPWLVARLGRQRYLGLYSLVSILCLVWMILAYGDAPFLPLWPESCPARCLAVIAMPASMILIVGALTPANPTLLIHRAGTFDASGLFAITRHPLMWGIGLACAVHILATGDLASLILFGAVGGLALAGTACQDARKRREDPALWTALAASTSNIPFAALLRGRAGLRGKGLRWPVIGGLAAYALLLAAHGTLFGVSPLP